jgi:hypothetical protein
VLTALDQLKAAASGPDSCGPLCTVIPTCSCEQPRGHTVIYLGLNEK